VETEVPTLEGVGCVFAKVEDDDAGDGPAETRDLRLVEGGLEAEAEAAVAGVAGAEARVVEEKEVSLRESEESSASLAALEIRELLRGVVVAGEGFVGEVPGVEEVGGPGMAGAVELRAKERDLEGELSFAGL